MYMLRGILFIALLVNNKTCILSMSNRKYDANIFDNAKVIS